MPGFTPPTVDPDGNFMMLSTLVIAASPRYRVPIECNSFAHIFSNGASALPMLMPYVNGIISSITLPPKSPVGPVSPKVPVKLALKANGSSGIPSDVGSNRFKVSAKVLEANVKLFIVMFFLDIFL